VERIGYDATGKRCFKALHDRDFICPDCVNDRVFNGETVCREMQSLRDNHWFHVVDTPIKQADGSIYKQSMSRDITEFKQEIAQRKQAEEALRKKNQDLVERLKELNCLYGISKLLEWPDLTFEEIFQGIVALIPPAWQYSEITCARIIIRDLEFKTENFTETVWKLASDIIVYGERTGAFQVCYLEERPESDDGPFLREEKRLIKAISECLGNVAERLWAMEELRSSEQRYRVLTENVAEAVMVVQAGKIVFANDNLISMFGYPSIGDVVGKDLRCLHCTELQKHFAMKDEVIESGNSNKSVFQARCTSLDGRDFWMETQYKIIKWEGKPAVLATLRDVTESKLKQIAFMKEKERLVKENINLRSTMKDRFRFDNIVGKSPGIQKVYDFITRASVSDANVVIEGESGTGKEVVALAIHKLSNRRDKPFVPVNCGAIPETLFESEFFGYRKGAFTGAYLDKPGLFDRAAGGTILLDEVAELSLNMQVKLLRAIEGKGYTPIGDNKVKQPDVRIIATSNRNLIDMLKKGFMRKDFFYRINIIFIHIPPLRNRKEDIPLLIDDFLQLYHGGKKAPTIPGEIMVALYNYDWPGNIRELQSVLVRYLTMNRLDFFNPNITTPPDGPENRLAIDFNPDNMKLQAAVEHLEKTLILKALHQTNCNKSKAARRLGISRRALFRKTEKFEIKQPDSGVFAHH
jgi:PAS domain S-box-containing protein